MDLFGAVTPFMRGSLEHDKFSMETFLTTVGFGSVCQGGKHRLHGCRKLAHVTVQIFGDDYNKSKFDTGGN
jgi:hypothetical protein